MCGIAGIFHLDAQPISRVVLNRMSKSIAHRGPDGEGFYLDHNFGLAHRRLSILDLSDMAAQPMTSKDGSWTIAFNGCIYNYRELKKELRAQGAVFNSTSDTEVISEGLAIYGPDFVQRLNGMFAIAAWNKKDRSVHLFRDRFGVKPLYYWLNKKTLLFASEIKAILQHPAYKVDLDKDALNEYFTFQNIFRFRTLFKGIIPLPPANAVRVDADSSRVAHNSWWDYDFSNPDESISFEEAKEETLRLMKQAVQRQMIADVPVGSYLSGGMDSGSITSIASKLIPRLSTFTCGFDMSSVVGVEANYDERRDAEIMANIFKTEHYQQVINSGDLSWSLPRVVHHLEDLKVGMSYPNYYISRLASKFVKVCLQGTGGDEIYGGYPWRYYRIFQSLNQQDFLDQYYEFWQRLVPDQDKGKLFNESMLNNVDIRDPKRLFERVFLFNEKLKYDTPEQHIQNSLYFEIKTFLPGLLLVGDKLSMANGLEERFPFLDNDLVNFAQRIPIRHKLANLEKMKSLDENTAKKKRRVYREFDDGKNVLRKAMESILPREVIERKKQGFSAPDESWYRTDNVQYVRDLLTNKDAAYREFINQKYVEDILDQHINKGQNHRLKIWSFMCFEWWCKIFLAGEVPKGDHFMNLQSEVYE
ncbi:MAG: asparagine synthase (glutamine-hydrolyzing) [Bacteroidota bacterium]